MTFSKAEIYARFKERHGEGYMRQKAKENYYRNHEDNKAKAREYRQRKAAEKLAANPKEQPKRGIDFIEFWSIPEPNSGCWLWIGAHDPNGYGRIAKRTYGTILAHRYSYLSHKADPGNLLVCHKCDNPACVNPDHMFLGTHKDNTQDMVKKGRARGRYSESKNQGRWMDE